MKIKQNQWWWLSDCDYDMKEESEVYCEAKGDKIDSWRTRSLKTSSLTTP